MAVDRKYLTEATDMLIGGKTNTITQTQNAYNTNVQSLEGQKAGTNQNFDNQLQQNTINTTKSQNNYLNNNLARGLGRSTIATSGAAGIKDSGNRIGNLVEQDRTNALNNIEAQKTILDQNLQATLLGLDTDFNSQVLNLAMSLEQTAYDRANRGSSGGSGGSGGSKGGSSSGNYDSAWGEFDGMMNNYINADGFSPLTWANQQYRAGNIDTDTYNAMVSVSNQAVNKKATRNANAQTERNRSYNTSRRQTK